MPSPRTTADSKPKPLSDTEIQKISAEIAEGKPPMVWFTSAAVGVTQGKSGKVVALGDPADEDFLQVRPTGSKDVLSFSRTEVTLTKPPRDKPAKSGAEKATPATNKESGASATESAPSPETRPTTGSEPQKSSPPASRAPDSATATHNGTAQNGTAQNNATAKGTVSKGAAEQTAASAKSTKPSAARKAKGPDITVTLTGTIDGDWTVDVTSGKKRSVRALPVSSSAVAQASKLLHPEVAEVVDSVLEAARGAQQAKVEQLQAELEQAKRTLHDLTD